MTELALIKWTPATSFLAEEDVWLYDWLLKGFCSDIRAHAAQRSAEEIKQWDQQMISTDAVPSLGRCPKFSIVEVLAVLF
ncbi:hypothetical protein J6590_018139 [Homalodisca vitripennis]|nr:hypothetical protein J6590_018139 [Homalodisca vitripennis]